MARLYHLTLLSVFLFLLLTGLVAADLSGGKKVGKKVIMTVRYPVAGSGEKVTISTHLVGEGGVGESHFNLDGDDYEPYATLSLSLQLIVIKHTLDRAVWFCLIE
ncbi:hypothetical protein D1007_62046 [Hordeum vulgare]|nr:hypothetical protein D1007_62046 [Hordeum vulgare]